LLKRPKSTTYSTRPQEATTATQTYRLFAIHATEQRRAWSHREGGRLKLDGQADSTDGVAIFTQPLIRHRGLNNNGPL